jgi:glycolate oxidase FAD binding subunit
LQSASRELTGNCGARPGTLEEASAYFVEASAAGRRIRIGEDLSTDGLARVLEHEPEDLTCTVEAGIRLSTLGAALAPHQRRLALDPPGDPRIGACLAGNLSGPLRHAFGAPRDLVLGVTLVLADGTIASAGGKVVKNVAGYDLGKLVCGSRGTLGLIARVSLRLHPVPGASRTLVVETDRAAAVVGELLETQLRPSALDVLHPGRVAVLFEGGEAGVVTQLDRARALIGGVETGSEVWEESRARQGEASGVIRFAPGELAAVLAGLDEAIVRPSVGVAYVPHEVASDLSAGVRLLNRAVKERFDPEGILV